MNSTSRYPAPYNTVKQPLPIADYLRSREGQTWTPANTEEVMRIFRRVDELASELVQRAREVGR